MSYSHFCRQQRHKVPPDYLFREAAVDVIDVLLQHRPRISVELLHSLQPPIGDKQASSLAVVGQHLQTKHNVLDVRESAEEEEQEAGTDSLY